MQLRGKGNGHNSVRLTLRPKRVIPGVEVLMAGPHPPALRDRVVQAWLRGEGTYLELAERFVVGPASVSRWLRALRERGNVAPKPMGGAHRERLIGTDGDAFVKAVFEAVPDSTLDEVAEAYEENFGVAVYPQRISESARRAGMSRKRGSSAR